MAIVWLLQGLNMQTTLQSFNFFTLKADWKKEIFKAPSLLQPKNFAWYHSSHETIPLVIRIKSAKLGIIKVHLCCFCTVCGSLDDSVTSDLVNHITVQFTTYYVSPLLLKMGSKESRRSRVSIRTVEEHVVSKQYQTQKKYIHLSPKSMQKHYPPTKSRQPPPKFTPKPHTA